MQSGQGTQGAEPMSMRTVSHDGGEIQEWCPHSGDTGEMGPHRGEAS